MSEPMSDERRAEIEHWFGVPAIPCVHDASGDPCDQCYVRDLLAEVDRLRSDLEAARRRIALDAEDERKMRVHWGDGCYPDPWDATGCTCSECTPAEHTGDDE